MPLTGCHRRRIGVVSDLHANTPALAAVLRDIEARGLDGIWCLGDIAGYGPGVVDVVGYVASRPTDPEGAEPPWTIVAGNHDDYLVWCYRGSPRWTAVKPSITPSAADAIEAQAEEMREAGAYGEKLVDWLGALPTLCRPLPHVILLHPRDGSTPVNPYAREPNLLDVEREHELLRREAGVDGRLILFRGHTHLPICFRRSPAPADPWSLQDWRAGTLELDGSSAWLNPGSVGECRVPGLKGVAQYAIYAFAAGEEETLSFIDVPYDSTATRIACSSRYTPRPAW